MPFDGVAPKKKFDALDAVIAKVVNRAPQQESDTVLVLREARRLVERGWCRRALAKVGFIPVPVHFPFATRYCAQGALMHASYRLGIYSKDADIILATVMRGSIPSFNDNMRKSDVLWAFDRAITRAIETPLDRKMRWFGPVSLRA
jgi:hypothetical protein